MPHAGLEGGGRAPGKGQGERQRKDSSPAREGTHRPALRGWASALQGCKVIHACSLGHRVCHSSQQQQETHTLALGLHTPCLDPQICPEGPHSFSRGLPPPTGTLQKLHVGASQPSGAAWRSRPRGRRELPLPRLGDRSHPQTALCSPHGHKACSEHVPSGDFSERG